MQLIELKMQGFIGLQKGLGLNEITLPLADLEGLVAFDGPNGRGKTTILENMQPYRMFASRRGTLKKHCSAKDSRKELTLEYNGDIIRTLIKMDPQTTRSDEGFIWINDKPMVDGKVSSYDAAITEIFGTANHFFWSIFCAQNSKKLTDLTTGQLKELFTEFLRLDRYLVYEDTVKQAMSMLTGIGQAAGNSIEHIKVELEKYAGQDPEAIIKAEGDNLEKSQGLLDQKEIEIGQITTGIQEKKAEIAANEEKIKQKKALSDDLVTAKAGLNGLEKEKYEKTRAISNKLAELDDTIKGLLNKLESAQDIKQAADRCFTLDAKIKGIGGELDDLYKKREQLNDEINNIKHSVTLAEGAFKDAEKRLAEVEGHTLEKDPDYIVMQAEIKGLEGRAKALDQKDADCISEKCGLITDALEAAGKLSEARDIADKYAEGWQEGLKESIEECAHVYEDMRDEKDLAQKKLSEIEEELDPINIKIKVLLREKSDLSNEFEDLSPLAKQLPELDIATAKLSGYEKQEQDLKDNLAALEKEYSTKLTEAQAHIDELAERIGKIEIDDKAADDLATLETGLEAAQASAKQLKEVIAQAERKILDAHRVNEAIKGLNAELEIAQANFKRVAGEQTEWQYLKEACGKKGLQALEIDGVSPVIEAYANDLLISTFGPMNTIRFETVSDEGKEVLNIVVMDPDGSETLLELKSGGEQVWILKALRLALTLLSKEKSGRNFKTVLMDEEDGALSAGNAVRFINLYRSMMDIGQFQTCYYISHKPEAVALANHRLVFNENEIGID